VPASPSSPCRIVHEELTTPGAFVLTSGFPGRSVPTPRIRSTRTSDRSHDRDRRSGGDASCAGHR
jgi:hypothetical protein